MALLGTHNAGSLSKSPESLLQKSLILFNPDFSADTSFFNSSYLLTSKEMSSWEIPL